MFKLSTKGLYGTRLMLDLALNYGNGPISLKKVADRQEISSKYLGNLVSDLKKERLVLANRGAYGGYELSRSPSEITLSEVVQAVEGPLEISKCVTSSKCKRQHLCIVRDVWKEVSDKVQGTLDSITLQDMVNKQIKKQGSTSYNI
ncbi:Rrf2 family transcriptional regulator [bacterium]|nr:Rrf2 family transcriptional regulator [bacterium]